MAKKVVISGYYGFKNFGDELILSILSQYLKTLNADVTVFSVDTEYTAQNYGVKSVNSFDLGQIIKTLSASDILISGGGSLFQDATSLKSILYYSVILAMAQILNKKTIIFAQGIGPLKSPISRFLVRNLFKKCDYVSVRDENSQKMLANWGVNSVRVCDPAFSLNVNQCMHEKVLGVQLRAFAGMNKEFLSDLAKVVNESEFEKVKILSLQKSQDFEIAKEFEKMLVGKSVEIVEEKIVTEISKLDTLIGMRFHSLVVGLKTGVKCCAINYDPKVQILAEKYAIPIIELDDSLSKMDYCFKCSTAKNVAEEEFPWGDILKFCQ